MGRLSLTIFLVLLALPASAQESGDSQAFYWDTTAAPNVRASLKKALGESAAGHLFEKKDIAKRLDTRTMDVPPCFVGVEECVSPYAMVFDALQLAGVVRISKTEQGYRYALIDRRKETVLEKSISEQDPNKAGFAIIAQLFDAMGTVVIETEPPGALVKIGDAEPAPSPVQARLPVGRHGYTVEKVGYKPSAGSFELGSGGVKNIQVDLPVIPAVIRFENATEGAEIYVDGVLAGPATQPLELQPGNHSIEIRKTGFRSIHEAIDAQPGQVMTRNATLKNSNPLLRDVSVEAIAHRKYHFRLAFEHGIQRATFQDARTSDGAFRFVGLSDESGVLPPGDPFRQLVHSNGVRAGALYQLRHVGLALMSASFVTGSPDVSGFVDTGTTDVEVTVDNSTRLQLRPFQINYRRFYKNFVPSIELGIGIDFHWFDATRADTGEALSFHRVESFWTLGFVGQYFITNGLFAYGKYGYQDYFTLGPGSDHLFNIGIGVAFGNLLGFDPEPPEKIE